MYLVVKPKFNLNIFPRSKIRDEKLLLLLLLVTFMCVYIFFKIIAAVIN